MVTPNPNLIVEIQLGSHKNKYLWKSTSPLHFSHPYGWTLSCHVDGYRLTKSSEAFEFSTEDGKNGISFSPKIAGKAAYAVIKVRPAVTEFENWIDLSTRGSGNGSELMVLRGYSHTLVKSTVVEAKFSSPHFAMERSGNGWRITALQEGLRVFDDSREIQIDKETDLPWGAVESLTFQQGETWWKFKRVSAGEIKYPAERFGSWAAHIFAVIAALLMIYRLPHELNGSSGTNAAAPRPDADSAVTTLVLRSTAKPIEKAPAPVEVAPAPQPTEPVKEQTAVAPVEVAAPQPQAKSETKVAKRPTPIDREALKRAREEKVLKKQADLLKKQMQEFEQFKTAKSPEKRPIEKLAANPESPKRESVLAAPDPFGLMPKTVVTSNNHEQMELKADLTRAPSASEGLSQPRAEHQEIQEALKVAAENLVVVEEPAASTIRGGLTQAQVEAAVVKQIDSIRTCYESALSRKSGISGRVSLSFIIGKTGSVEAAKVAESNIDDPLLHKCLVKRLGGWTFPLPSDQSPVSVSYPFLFKTVGVNP